MRTAFVILLLLAIRLPAQTEDDVRSVLFNIVTTGGDGITTNVARSVVIPVSGNYSVSPADVFGMRASNLLFAVDTTAGSVIFTLPASFPNTFGVMNTGTNSVNIIAANGQTIPTYLTNNGVSFRAGLTNSYAGKTHELIQLNATNVAVRGEFKPLLNVLESVRNNIALIGLSSGTNGTQGIQGATGNTGAQGTNGLGFTATAKLTADLLSANSTGMTNTTGLSFNLSSNIYYQFTFNVLFQSSNVTTGLKLCLTNPVSTVFSARSDIPIAADGTAAIRVGWHTNSGDVNIGTAVESSNTTYMATISGVIVPQRDGVLQVQHGSEVSASGVTVKQGSLGTLITAP